jgi:hypothetical protein
MGKAVGVFIIHGMGDPEPDFAEGLQARLRQRLGEEADKVAFEACYWSPILQKQQDLIWQRILLSRLDQKRARHWVVSALGDPVGYLSGFFKAGRPVYDDIHECMRAQLEKLAAALENPDQTPLLILAHSLGSVIVSNYIWDENHGEGIGRTPFQRTDTLTSLITYGSNIPLFIPPVPQITNIRFPSPRLPAHLAPAANWLNVYDPDDILGYPLCHIWDDSQGTVVHDLVLNVGPWPLSETPFSHVLYAQDSGFLRLVEEQIRSLLALPAPPGPQV